MALYEVEKDGLRAIAPTSLADHGIRERGDLQRLLRTQIDAIDDGLLVLAEEFSDWEDSKRRVDLLALDRNANLVVVELKRTVDGGHMELQALRYAAMVSTMTFDRAAEAHARFLSDIGEPDADARQRILDFLGWESPEEDVFAGDVRIVLVSEDFGRELTTTVLWLLDRGLDIRCVRLRPYADNGRLLLDIQQVIPLPEAEDFQVRLREKEEDERRTRAERYDVRLEFWTGLVALARNRGARHGSRSPGPYHYLEAGSGISGVAYVHIATQHWSSVDLYIDRGDAQWNKDLFDRLHNRHSEIEARFDGPLEWERLDQKKASRIRHRLGVGGYRSPRTEWPAIHEAMIGAMQRLEAALEPELKRLGA